MIRFVLLQLLVLGRENSCFISRERERCFFVCDSMRRSMKHANSESNVERERNFLREREKWGPTKEMMNVGRVGKYKGEQWRFVLAAQCL